MLALPSPRGELSAALLDALPRPVHAITAPGVPGAASEDVQLALYLCYELHYRGAPGVDPAWEWEPSLLALRRELEARLLDSLPPRTGEAPAPEAMDVALREIAGADDGPSLSRHLDRDGTLGEVLELFVHRSAYQLKEADPHSWAIPRLSGRPKAALIEIQADEYGGGRAERIHAQLFADAMEALGLDARYGAYLDVIPGVTLATVNLMSLFGLHRRWLGALVGHLALFEMTSSVPNGRYARALRRLGFEGRATAFFDEHVAADAVHENIAAVDLAGGFARAEPHLAPDVLWGARCLTALEDRWTAHVLDAWAAGESSLRGAPLGLRRGGEADELVAAVAEGPDA